MAQIKEILNNIVQIEDKYSYYQQIRLIRWVKATAIHCNVLNGRKREYQNSLRKKKPNFGGSSAEKLFIDFKLNKSCQD